MAKMDKKTKAEVIALQAKGFRVIKEGVLSCQKFDVREALHGDELKFGLVSDTHLGSRHQQLSFLNLAYDYFQEQGITRVFHGGDMFEGSGRMFPGQEEELFVHGGTRALEYGVDVYPKRKVNKKLIKTDFIGGSHDYSFMKTGGFDILKALGEKRPDMRFLGYVAATMAVKHPKYRNRIRVMLIHPKGGIPYSRSYRCQKIIESLSPEKKPEVLLLGHLHAPNHLPAYRNVEAIMLPCFQAQTLYLAGGALAPVVGFAVLTLGINRRDRKFGGFFKVDLDWHFFYVPLENDY